MRGDEVLLVQRPADDEDLPNAWGLPAASLQADESWEDAAVRAARDKLGVDVEVSRELQAGALQRRNYRLEMKLYEAAIVAGTPAVPQPRADVTQYQDWKWGTAEALQPAADAGSLCCRLFLEHSNAD